MLHRVRVVALREVDHPAHDVVHLASVANHLELEPQALVLNSQLADGLQHWHSVNDSDHTRALGLTCLWKHVPQYVRSKQHRWCLPSYILLLPRSQVWQRGSWFVRWRMPRNLLWLCIFVVILVFFYFTVWPAMQPAVNEWTLYVKEPAFKFGFDDPSWAADHPSWAAPLCATVKNVNTSLCPGSCQVKADGDLLLNALSNRYEQKVIATCLPAYFCITSHSLKICRQACSWLWSSDRRLREVANLMAALALAYVCCLLTYTAPLSTWHSSRKLRAMLQRFHALADPLSPASTQLALPLYKASNLRAWMLLRQRCGHLLACASVQQDRLITPQLLIWVIACVAMVVNLVKEWDQAMLYYAMPLAFVLCAPALLSCMALYFVNQEWELSGRVLEELAWRIKERAQSR